MGFHGALVWREGTQPSGERKPAESGPGGARGERQSMRPCRASTASGPAKPTGPACLHPGNFSFLDIRYRSLDTVQWSCNRSR